MTTESVSTHRALGSGATATRVFSDDSMSFDDGVVERMLGPHGCASLKADYYGKKPLFIAGHAKKFDGLFGWAAVNTLMRQEHYHARRSDRLAVRDDASRPPESDHDTRTVLFRRTGTEVQDRVSGMTTRPVRQLGVQQLHSIIRDTANLQLFALNETWPTLMRLSEYLEAAFHERFEISAVANSGKIGGFELHFDTNDSFICQVAGRQQWTIYEPSFVEPRMDQRRERDLLGRVQEARQRGADAQPRARTELESIMRGEALQQVLEPGDILYLPSGWWHTAEAIEEPTLYLSCDFRPVTAVGFIADAVAKSHRLRRRLPRFGTQSEKNEYMASVRHELLNLCENQLDLEAFLASYDGEAPGPNRPSIPRAFQSQSLSPDDRLIWNPLRPVAIELDREADEMTFITMGQEWEFEDGAEAGAAIIELIQARRVCSVRDVLSLEHCQGVEFEIIDEFLRDLVMRGLLSLIIE